MGLSVCGISCTTLTKKSLSRGHIYLVICYLQSSRKLNETIWKSGCGWVSDGFVENGEMFRPDIIGENSGRPERVSCTQTADHKAVNAQVSFWTESTGRKELDSRYCSLGTQKAPCFFASDCFFERLKPNPLCEGLGLSLAHQLGSPQSLDPPAHIDLRSIVGEELVRRCVLASGLKVVSDPATRS